MGWRGRGSRVGPWPGRGPFSYLPPWQRPGWLYGRGACWWLFTPQLQTNVPQVTPAAVTPVPFMSTFTKEQEMQMLGQQTKILEAQLDAIRKRLVELQQEESS